MYPKRSGQDDSAIADRGGDLAAVETARSASQHPPAAHAKDDEKMSVFWRVFGGTILSIIALVAITLYNNLNGSITDLRQELSREREARAALAKKDDVDTRIKSQWDRIRLVEGYKADIEGVKERVAANAAAVDAAKKDAAGLEVLRERVSLLEGVRKDIAGLESIKEKVTTTAGDLKAYRDDLQKVQQDVERNKSGDLERKSARDSQMKALEDTLREVQKGLMDCREKLARLEGAAGPTKPTAKQPE